MFGPICSRVGCKVAKNGGTVELVYAHIVLDPNSETWVAKGLTPVPCMNQRLLSLLNLRSIDSPPGSSFQLFVVKLCLSQTFTFPLRSEFQVHAFRTFKGMFIAIAFFHLPGPILDALLSEFCSHTLCLGAHPEVPSMSSVALHVCGTREARGHTLNVQVFNSAVPFCNCCSTFRSLSL